jgi:hypothetical protein
MLASCFLCIEWELLDKMLIVLEEEGTFCVDLGVLLWGLLWSVIGLDSMLHLL